MAKFAIVMYFLATLVRWTSGMSCWTCENAGSPSQCVENGQSTTCRTTENSCQTEVRSFERNRVLITARCKELHACTNNEVQNPRAAWYSSQCDAGRVNSVCRCCCSGDQCNKNNLLCNPVNDPPKISTKAPPEPQCKQFPKKPLNGERTCNNGKFEGSRCSFSCDDGYKLIGSTFAVCKLIRGRHVWNRRTPACEEIETCPGIEILEHGRTECTGSREEGAICTFHCFGGYEMVGPSEISCDRMEEGVRWSDGPPSCIKNCPGVEILEHGRTECTGSGGEGTVCAFHCFEGYEMVGLSEISCDRMEEGVQWSDDPPSCIVIEPTPGCEDLGSLAHGTISCTTEDYAVETECFFECTTSGYKLLPSDRLSTHCEMNGETPRWSLRKPCCNAECPPLALKDIVILIDSSKSINDDEWEIMKNFTIDVIDRFRISEDYVQIAAFRFNGKVDTDSQILFGSYAGKEDLSDAIRAMEKKGAGTKIGNALTHAKDVVLQQNNRPHAGDMIWVLTDGRSKDNVTEISRELREDENVEIIALGIDRNIKRSNRRTGRTQLEELIDITGDIELVMQVENVVDSLVDEFVEIVANKICQVSCDE